MIINRCKWKKSRIRHNKIVAKYLLRDGNHLSYGTASQLMTLQIEKCTSFEYAIHSIISLKKEYAYCDYCIIFIVIKNNVPKFVLFIYIFI